MMYEVIFYRQSTESYLRIRYTETVTPIIGDISAGFIYLNCIEVKA